MAASPSTRGCGLKSIHLRFYKFNTCVTLHARVWIEMPVTEDEAYRWFVTLHARVWIEIVSLLALLR